MKYASRAHDVEPALKVCAIEVVMRCISFYVFVLVCAKEERQAKGSSQMATMLYRCCTVVERCYRRLYVLHDAHARGVVMQWDFDLPLHVLTDSTIQQFDIGNSCT